MKLFLLLPLALLLLATGCAKEQVIGGQTDDHGCLIAAGYSWCDARQECIRPWETPCTVVNASELCGDEEVYQCGEYVKVVHELLGAGATYYRPDGTQFDCPVVAPESMSADCLAVFELSCDQVDCS